MAKFVGARVYNSGNISVNASTLTALTFDSERFDTDTVHSTSSNTGRLTCQTAGIYTIGGNIRWANNLTGQRQMTIRLNGATYIANSNMDAVSDGTVFTLQNINCIYELALTDYVELVVYQTSGGALNVTNSGNVSPEFWMHRVG